MKKWFVLAGVAVLAIAVGLFAALRREDSGVVAPVAVEVAGTRSVNLFFPGASGGLQRETREILGSDFLAVDVRRTVEELIAGPESGPSPFPAGTLVLSTFFDQEGEVTVNFSDHLTTDHPGGSAAEIETIRCLVTTIGRNFPGVDRVRILIDGDVAATLAGHTDLSRPLPVDDYR
ncbi:MAG: hypothetical protein DHS20C21_21960 [Gemmatimonadota bacterium]|nr:MAG: hypothetical protein DHS20C21_21960 [Gemmatimonadota bacterium]